MQDKSCKPWQKRPSEKIHLMLNINYSLHNPPHILLSFKIYICLTWIKNISANKSTFAKINSEIMEWKTSHSGYYTPAAAALGPEILGTLTLTSIETTCPPPKNFKYTI